MLNTMSKNQRAIYNMLQAQIGMDNQLDWLLESIYKNGYDNAIDDSLKIVDSNIGENLDPDQNK